MAEPRQEWESLADFLATAPPSSEGLISKLINSDYSAFSNQKFQLITPDAYLDRTSDSCDGFRFFRCFSSREITVPEVDRDVHACLIYACRNCSKSHKVFALAIRRFNDGPKGIVVKIGETPPFGPRTPARVTTLIGPDRDLFLKGRRCETQGLGVGAYAYYRRIVENQKSRLFDEIIGVAKRIGADPAAIKTLVVASKEQQFKKAVDTAKNAIPDILRIDGQSPLKLLHSALSDGLHDQSDEHCLELATDIRTILFVLAERIEVALREDTEIKSALSRLLNKQQTPGK